MVDSAALLRGPYRVYPKKKVVDMLIEQFRVENVEEAVEIARAFALDNELSEVAATAFATSWYDVCNDFDSSTADRLRSFLCWRFGIGTRGC